MTPTPKDISGQRFGRLLAIERKSEKKNDRVRSLWLCLCDCGSEKWIPLGSLTRGLSRSCGCLQGGKWKPRKDLTGQRFGKLIVLEQVIRVSRRIYYRCLCECGKESEVLSGNLTSGNSKSCGCDFIAGRNNQKGINHYRYDHNLSEEERVFRRIDSPEGKEWSKSVKERDNFTCQLCGLVGGELRSHHLEAWNSRPDLRYDLSNGVCLCNHCHDLFHGKYKRGMNTKVQFEEFSLRCKDGEFEDYYIKRRENEST